MDTNSSGAVIRQNLLDRLLHAVKQVYSVVYLIHQCRLNISRDHLVCLFLIRYRYILEPDKRLQQRQTSGDIIHNRTSILIHATSPQGFHTVYGVGSSSTPRAKEAETETDSSSD